MIYQNYKLDKAELCLHTVSTNGGGGQIWQVFLVPWNRPSFRAARVKPNLLPGCQWRIFDTTGYSGVGIGSGEGSTNEIGVGGALYVTQNDPKFYVDIYGANAAATLTGQLPMSMAMPTVSVHGRDTTEWMCFLWRLRMIKGDPSQDTYFLYTVKLYFTFTGIRLSQAGGLTQLALGCDYPRQPDAFPTYDDPAEQERRFPILRHLVRGENQHGQSHWHGLVHLKRSQRKSWFGVVNAKAWIKPITKDARDKTLNDSEAWYDRYVRKGRPTRAGKTTMAFRVLNALQCTGLCDYFSKGGGLKKFWDG